ncbi:MAG TPA: hypothetical protein VN643_19410 [Pyrinomonadaceae bacterium]|nr:hypothetical protein [Pyrinomonadaceae bacterium]
MAVFQRRRNGLRRLKITSIEADECHKEAIELYKMEYERCAERYNNLYNAAWTNFSYMVLVAGGVLTFGGARFVTPLTGLLSCLPLLFWWFSTFEPLNRYGDSVEQQLCEIEKALNALCFSQLKNIEQPAKKGLTHFSYFSNRGGGQSTSKRKLVKSVATLAIFSFALTLALRIFLNIDQSALLAVPLLVLLGLVIFVTVELFEKTGWQQETRFAVSDFRRVRFRVRVAGYILLIASTCFTVKVIQLQTQGRPLTLPLEQASKAPSHQ